MKKQLLLICLIAFVLFLLIFFIVPMGAEKTNEPAKKPMTLEEKVHNINMNMPQEERSFRQYYGLGNETIGENYNSMGSSSAHI